MKKMMVWKVISLFIAAGLIFFAVFARQGYIAVKRDRFIVRGKYYGLDRDVRDWITPQEEELPVFQGTDFQKVSQAYDYLEKHYQYVPDKDIEWTNGSVRFNINGDFWQTPAETQAIIKKVGHFEGDCEDGSFWLQSDLEKNRVPNTFVCIGTVDLESGTYGHAWVIWRRLGKDYLLETTLGRSLETLKVVPSFYHPDFVFNSKTVYAITGVDINEVITRPPLPPADVNELRKALGY